MTESFPRRTRHRVAVPCLLALLALAATGRAVAGEYFSQPMYWIGLPGKTATQVTTEGNLHNGQYEYAFYTGLDMRALTGITFSTPDDGRPLVRGSTVRDVFRYDMEYFSAPLALEVMLPPQADVATVKITNTGTTAKVARFWAGVLQPERPHRAAVNVQSYFWGWRCEFRRNVIAHANKVIGVYPTGYAERFWYPGRGNTGRFAPNSAETSEHNPILLARYEFHLAPGADTTVSFVYPAEPAPDSYPVLIQGLGAAGLKQRFEQFWAPVLAALPAPGLGSPLLDRFARHQMIQASLQMVQAGTELAPLANKNLSRSLELLDMEPYLRAWSGAGLAQWTRRGLLAARYITQAHLVLYSGRDGRAPTAGIVGLESELDAGASLELSRQGVEDTLALRADTLATWAGPGTAATPLELAAGAWALGEYARHLGRVHRADAAQDRTRQAAALAAAARARLEALGDAALLLREPAALRWLARAGAVPEDWARAHLDASRHKLWNGLVTDGADSVVVAPTLARALALPAGDAEGTRSLLALVARTTQQGALPAGFRASTRDFGQALPSEGTQAMELLLALQARAAGGQGALSSAMADVTARVNAETAPPRQIAKPPAQRRR